MLAILLLSISVATVLIWAIVMTILWHGSRKHDQDQQIKMQEIEEGTERLNETNNELALVIDNLNQELDEKSNMLQETTNMVTRVRLCPIIERSVLNHVTPFSIPFVVFQTYKTQMMPQQMANCMFNNRTSNLQFQFVLFDDVDMGHFMHTYYPQGGHLQAGGSSSLWGSVHGRHDANCRSQCCAERIFKIKHTACSHQCA
jgi:mannosyltransferase OCH1-like enzyme